MAPRIANLPQWRAHLLARLHRQAQATGDQRLTDLHAELSARLLDFARLAGTGQDVRFAPVS